MTDTTNIIDHAHTMPQHFTENLLTSLLAMYWVDDLKRSDYPTLTVSFDRLNLEYELIDPVLHRSLELIVSSRLSYDECVRTIVHKFCMPEYHDRLITIILRTKNALFDLISKIIPELRYHFEVRHDAFMNFVLRDTQIFDFLSLNIKASPHPIDYELEFDSCRLLGCRHVTTLMQHTQRLTAAFDFLAHDYKLAEQVCFEDEEENVSYYKYLSSSIYASTKTFVDDYFTDFVAAKFKVRKRARPSSVKRRVERALKTRVLKHHAIRLMEYDPDSQVEPQGGFMNFSLDEQSQSSLEALTAQLQQGIRIEHASSDHLSSNLQSLISLLDKGVEIKHRTGLDDFGDMFTKTFAKILKLKGDYDTGALVTGCVALALGLYTIKKATPFIRAVLAVLTIGLTYYHFDKVKDILPFLKPETDLYHDASIDMDDIEPHGAFSTYPVVHAFVGFLFASSTIAAVKSWSVKDFLKDIKDMSRIKDGIEFAIDWFLEIASMFVTKVNKVFGTEYDFSTYKNNDARAYAERVDALIRDFDAGIPMNHENGSRVQAILSEGRQLLINTPRDRENADARQMIQSSLSFLKPITQRLERANITGNGPRIEALGIMFGGSPGTAKSTIITFMQIQVISRVLPAKGLQAFLNNHVDFILNRSVANGFWDGYHGQFATHIDDLGQTVDVAGNDNNIYMEAIQMINTTNYHLNMAGIEDKANTNFNSRLVTATTNRRRFTNMNTIIDSRAFTRRFKSSFWQFVHREYALESTLDLSPREWMVDQDKVPEGFLDYMYFCRHDFATGKTDTSVKYSLQEVIDSIVALYDKTEVIGQRILDMHQKYKEKCVADRVTKDAKLGTDLKIKPQGADTFGPSQADFHAIVQANNKFKVAKGINPSMASMVRERVQADEDFVHEIGLDPNIFLVPEYADFYFRSLHLHCEYFKVAKPEVACAVGDVGIRWYARQCFNLSLQYDTHIDEIVHNRANYRRLPVRGKDVLLLHLLHEEMDKIPAKFYCSGFISNGLEGIRNRINWKYVAGLTAVVAGVSALIFVLRTTGVLPQGYEDIKIVQKAKKANRGKRGNVQRISKGKIREQSSLNPNVANFGERLYRKNMFFLFIDGKQMGSFLFIKGRIALSPAHYYDALTRLHDLKGDSPDFLTLVKCGCPTVTFSFSYADLEWAEVDTDVDLMFVTFPAIFPACSDIVKYFDDDEYSEPNHYFGCLVVPKEKHMSSTVTRFNHLPEITYTEYTNGFSYQYSIPTAKGDCGAPLLLCDSRVQVPTILGIHVAGTTATGYTIGITKTMIETALNFLDEQISLVLEDDLAIVPQLSDTTVALGRVVQPRVMDVTQIMKSPLYEKWGPSREKPSYLKPFMRGGSIIDPVAITRKKFSRGNPVVNVPLLEACASATAHALWSATDTTSEPWLPRIYSFEESTYGIEGVPFCESLPRQTSPGYPLKLHTKRKGKNEIMGEPGNAPFSGPLGAQFLDDVKAADARIRKLERVPMYYTDQSKDARVPIAKADAGKVRRFNISPMALTVLVRRYFGDAMRCIMKHRIHNGSAMGVNPLSVEWEFIARKLNSKGTKVGAGDFRNYDGSLPCVILYCAFFVLETFYVGATAEERNARSVLCEELVNSYHVDGGIIVEWFGSNVSGSALTTTLNNVCQMITARYTAVCSHLRARDIDPLRATRVDYIVLVFEYDEHVYLIVFGDDGAWNVSDEWISVVNQKSMTYEYAQLGMTYTDEMKNENSEILYKSLDAISFLKRDFKFTREHGVLAPLSLDTILEAPYWTKKGIPQSEYVATLENMYCELSFHDKEVFDKYAPLFIEHGAHIGFIPKLHNQNDVIAYWKTKEAYW